MVLKFDSNGVPILDPERMKACAEFIDGGGNMWPFNQISEDEYLANPNQLYQMKIEQNNDQTA